jgi:hypothetical protein
VSLDVECSVNLLINYKASRHYLSIRDIE